MQQTRTKKYQTRHDWVGKVIHKELDKKLEFSYTSKWCLHKPEAVLENKTHKIFCDFNIKTDHLIRLKDQT